MDVMKLTEKSNWPAILSFVGLTMKIFEKSRRQEMISEGEKLCTFIYFHVPTSDHQSVP